METAEIQVVENIDRKHKLSYIYYVTVQPAPNTFL